MFVLISHVERRYKCFHVRNHPGTRWFYYKRSKLPEQGLYGTQPWVVVRSIQRARVQPWLTRDAWILLKPGKPGFNIVFQVLFVWLKTRLDVQDEWRKTRARPKLGSNFIVMSVMLWKSAIYIYANALDFTLWLALPISSWGNGKTNTNQIYERNTINHYQHRRVCSISHALMLWIPFWRQPLY
jgi:hypothetical protein